MGGQEGRRAAHFLATTGLPVKTIAGKIGDRSRSDFSRALKARSSVDPNAYHQDAGQGVGRGAELAPPAASAGG